MDDIEQTLREWRFQGGPKTLDRHAAENPLLFALLYATGMAVALSAPPFWLALRDESGWAVVVVVTIFVAGWLLLFFMQLQSARHREEALERWEAE